MAEAKSVWIEAQRAAASAVRATTDASNVVPAEISAPDRSLKLLDALEKRDEAKKEEAKQRIRADTQVGTKATSKASSSPPASAAKTGSTSAPPVLPEKAKSASAKNAEQEPPVRTKHKSGFSHERSRSQVLARNGRKRTRLVEEVSLWTRGAVQQC